MAAINNISGNNDGFKRIERDKNLKRTKSSRETRPGNVSTAPAENAKVIKKDIVNISLSGKSLFKQKNELEHYLKEIDSIKTLSKEELLKIHQRIKSDFYSKPEVLIKIVEDIVSQGPTDTQTTAVSEEGPRQLSEISSKIANGDYNSDEVLDVIVEKLLNPTEFV